ncbi:hypothetical protein [Pseudoalteromonas phenolica]|uniref:hypothetical protein n=1 Tax=Pseudoalteromonas phenolica TaxID=161398 RepID=UPI001F4FE418|nr:hypothetical protein [Pseudoalteromonas phenolica]
MRKILTSILFVAVMPAAANDFCQIVDGSVIIAQDSKNTYLGKIINSFDSESIFNEFGPTVTSLAAILYGTSFRHSVMNSIRTLHLTSFHLRRL